METLALKEVEILVLVVVEVELIVLVLLQGMKGVVVAIEEILVRVRGKGYPQGCHPRTHYIYILRLR